MQTYTISKNTLIFSSVIAVLLLVMFIIIKRNRKDDFLDDLEEEAGGQEPTLSNAAASAIADALYGALSSYWVYEDQVYQNLRRLNNKADWALVNRKFGTREISNNWSTSLKSGNLVEFLHDRLDDDEVQEVRKILSQIEVTF